MPKTYIPLLPPGSPLLPLRPEADLGASAARWSFVRIADLGRYRESNADQCTSTKSNLPNHFQGKSINQRHFFEIGEAAGFAEMAGPHVGFE